MLGAKYLRSTEWESFLSPLLESANFKAIHTFVEEEKSKGKTIFPPENEIFNAFNSCPFDACKVIILGQDPYHNDGQAHGLSFSVPKHVKIPPSLRNMYKEIADDCNINNQEHGNLEHWANQGVLLLNAILTVNAHEPASHRESGWEAFTDGVIQQLSSRKEHLVFLLWGSFAQSKAKLIDAEKHLILSSVHPSPLSAYRGFFECKHFSLCNEYLQKHGKESIDWNV